MTLTVLLTGFGPFPGVFHNPTGPLVQQLARLRRPALADVRLVPHVFETSYRAVDDALPKLLAEFEPDALLMFGLATRASCLRVEMRARNALSVHADAQGKLPPGARILRGGPDALAFGAAAQRLALAACDAGAPAVTSRNAGRYLCNYLSWRGIEAAALPEGPSFTAFVHVPPIASGQKPQRGGRKVWRMADLLRGSEAILLAALAETRRRGHMAET